MEQCGFSGTFQEGADSCDEFKSLRICVCGRVEQGFSNFCLLASWCSQASSISSLLFVIVVVLDSCKSDQICLEISFEPNSRNTCHMISLRKKSSTRHWSRIAGPYDSWWELLGLGILRVGSSLSVEIPVPTICFPTCILLPNKRLTSCLFVFVSPFVLAFGMVFDVFVGLLRGMYITNQRLVQICQDMNSLNGI